jgi:hypothetical protein
LSWQGTREDSIKQLAYFFWSGWSCSPLRACYHLMLSMSHLESIRNRTSCHPQWRNDDSFCACIPGAWAAIKDTSSIEFILIRLSASRKFVLKFPEHSQSGTSNRELSRKK